MAFWLGNYNDRFELVESPLTQAPGGADSISATATCPVTLRPLGGGGKTSSNDLLISDSFPSGAGATWVVRWESDNNTAIPDTVTASAWALCGPSTVQGAP